MTLNKESAVVLTDRPALAGSFGLFNGLDFIDFIIAIMPQLLGYVKPFPEIFFEVVWPVPARIQAQ